MERPARAAHTERGLERLIIFTDAVIAIAATLLILPIIDAISDAFSDEGGLSDLASDRAPLQVMAFVVGFVTMTQAWRLHHGTFELVKDYSRGLVMWNFVWLFAMVFLALPAGFLYSGQGNGKIIALYLFNLGVIWAVLSSTRIYVLRRPELLVDPDRKIPKPYYAWLLLPLVSLFSLALAFLIIGVFEDGPIDFAATWPVWLLLFPWGLLYIYPSRFRMPHRSPHTERGMDRLVFFSDAVVAIAITLLVLPLVNVITEDQGDTQNLTQSVSEIVAKIIVFAFSFWLMSRQWLINHRLFENVKDYSGRLVTLIFAWLLFMVILAIPSALMGHALVTQLGVRENAYQELTDYFPEISLLFGTVMALISLTTALTERYLRHHPELLVDPTRLPSPRANYYVAILYFALGALPFAFIWVDLNTIGLGLFLSVLLAPFVSRLAERQDAAKRAANTQTQV